MRAIPVLLGALALVGCLGPHRATQPRLADDIARLDADLAVLPPFPEPAPLSGSLWTDAGPGAALVRDPRAFRINDLVTIRVDERSLGTNESATDLSRSSQVDVGAAIAFGLEEPDPQPGEFNLNQVLSADSQSEFNGDGKTSRSSRLESFITARVLRVLPNGDLVIAGQKSVVVNRERQVLTLVGSVRSVDIDSDNTVPSAAIGDLTVRLWGHGEVDDTVRQGWFLRILNRVWPF
jgi:flagellar L-ring protein precursor FlgH